MAKFTPPSGKQHPPKAGSHSGGQLHDANAKQYRNGEPTTSLRKMRSASGKRS
jgi:hypothetical protein